MSVPVNPVISIESRDLLLQLQRNIMRRSAACVDVEHGVTYPLPNAA